MARNRKIIQQVAMLALGMSLSVAGSIVPAWARDLDYGGKEMSVYVNPGEPTQITFPNKIEGGFKRKHSALALERQGNFLVVFAQPELPYEGEALLVHTADKRSFAIRVLPSDDDNPRDEFVNIKDLREDSSGNEGEGGPQFTPRGFPPASVPPGLMRELVLIAEFGKRGGISGYRRSNRYTGETILNDGTIEAKIEEIFLGTDMWGYIVDGENLTDATYKLNPASFRLDGTMAVGAERWELAARPVTAEQEVSKAYKGKVYIITHSQRR